MRKGLFFAVAVIFLAVVAGLLFLSQNENETAHFPSGGDDYRVLVTGGDRYFSKMHLFGWRKAETCYSHAYQIKKSPELRDRLFLTRCLIAIREKDEQISNPGTDKKIDELEDFPKNPKQQLIFDLVQRYDSAKVFRRKMALRALQKRYVDISLFDVERSPLDLYLYLYLLRHYTLDSGEYDERYARLLDEKQIQRLVKQNSRNPLFIYRDLLGASPFEKEIENQYPQFAEFFLFQGDRYFKLKKYKNAFKCYEKALALLPRYTKAVNGVGNIYYFTVRNYEKALVLYQKTLDLDPRNPVALFGKGVSLHNLGRYRESMDVLDFMLKSQRMYHGEAYYFKAYNYFEMGLFDLARDKIDRAKVELPDSGEVHALSGRLYLGEKKPLEAGGDFLKAMMDEKFSPCSPLYLLGRIHLKSQSWLFFDYFEQSCECYGDTQARMVDEIKKIDSMDISAPLKKWMKKDRTLKYEEYKKMSDAGIGQMQAILAENRKNKPAVLPVSRGSRDHIFKGKGNSPLHMAAIKGNLAEMENLLAGGHAVDVRNKEGNTPLHSAVVMGRVDAVRCLIRAGADVNVQAPTGYRPIHDAAFGGHKEIVEQLINRGASVYVEEGLGKTPMLLAMEGKQEQVFPLLKPIHRAVIAGDIQTLDQLLTENPERINTMDEKGRTPLYLAVVKEKTEIVRRLIERGGDVNIPDFDGFSPLYRTESGKHAKIREMLLSHKAVYTNTDMLARPVGKGEASVWYIGRGGWVVKTADHVLLFDFLPLRPSGIIMLGGPFIREGNVNPLPIKDRKVVIFVSHVPFRHPLPMSMFDWGRAIPGIRYVLGWKEEVYSDCFYIPSGEERRMEELDIRTFKTGGDFEESLGFLVKVDDVVILFGGGDGCTLEAVRSAVGNWKGIDLAFLPVHGRGDHSQNAETLQIVKEFRPRVMFPLYAGWKEYYYREFADKVEKEDVETSVHYAHYSGHYFSYRHREIK